MIMIFLDHNATSPILSEAKEVMMKCLGEDWGNPSSIYGIGRIARSAVEEARGRVAALLGCDPGQVIFTSSATEANNAAIHSAIYATHDKRHIVTSSVEHSAVLSYCEYLESVHGAEVTRLPVLPDGGLEPGTLNQAIRPDTSIVSLMWANNETGVIWPIDELASICKENGVPFHSDAVQAVGKIRVSFLESGLNSLTLSGHKFGAPKGVGALIVNDPDKFVPFIYGGKQELGMRGGTENVPCIVGIGKAAEIVNERYTKVSECISSLRVYFESEIQKAIGGCQINGVGQERLPNTSNVYLPGLDGDALVTFLDQKGICISSGSACMENAITPSHVLLAMSGSHDVANESIRVSLGSENTKQDVDQLVTEILEFSKMMA